MSIDNLQLDAFLVGDVRPWLESQSDETVFRSQLANIKENSLPDFLIYTFNFQRPISDKTKYYSRLIQNALIADLNSIFNELENNDDERVIKYILDKILNKKLNTKIIQIGQIIRDKDYSLSYINPAIETQHIDKELKDNIFITQLLKNTFINLYLNIQEKYRNYIDDILEPIDFYTQLLSEPAPSSIPFKKPIIIEVVEGPMKKEKTQHSNESIEPKSFTYVIQLNADEKLADAFDRLKSNKLIDESTTLPNFKRIFSGREVKTPVKWTAKNSDLYYFIKLLYSEEKLLKDLKQKQWKVAENCFLDADGDKYDMSKIKSLKKPATTSQILEMIVSRLK